MVKRVVKTTNKKYPVSKNAKPQPPTAGRLSIRFNGVERRAEKG
jgi:hypothetical protein